MKTELKPVAENEVLLEVEVPQDEVNRRYEQTLARLARETNLPGFRPGRAPKAMVLNRLGADYVREQTIEDSLPDWYEAAVRAAEVDAVGITKVDYEGMEETLPFAFAITLQTRPVPALGQYKGIEAPRRPVEVTDSQVDAQLAMFQERFASLKPVEGRPVQDGDFVVADLEGRRGDEIIEGSTATNYMLQVGKGHFIPGFEENVLGMSAGETRTFDVTFPEDYSAEELRGVEATFTVEVKEIKEKLIPELDDEFAKEVSEFETLAELRTDIRERLEQMQKAAADREFRGRVVDLAVANATFAVPPAMIEREAHQLYHDLESSVGEQGVTMETYLQVMEKTPEQVEEELHPRAEMNVRRRLVLDAIREAEGVDVTDDEVRERIKADAELIGREPDQLVIDVYASGRQAVIRDELVMAKTVDLLVDEAVATEWVEEEHDHDHEADADPD